MFPKFWIYLLKSFFRVFTLCVCGFIAVLLVTRLKEIARFAALATGFKNVIAYTLYQIPHILPIAIPISCLISALLLFQRLSQNGELTAMRSSGLSIREIITPLLFAGFTISILNFFVVSEIAPRSRLHSKEIIFYQSTINPIVLLQRQNLLKIKNSFLDFTSNSDLAAEDLLFITPNRANERLNLLAAMELEFKDNHLLGKNVCMISHIAAPKEDSFDTLVIENQQLMSTQANMLSQFMKKSRWSLNMNYLPLRQLLIKQRLQAQGKESVPVEILRRVTLAIAAFSFTFIGICFGMRISRSSSKKGIFKAAALSVLILLCFLVSKTVKYHHITAIALLILPQPFIFAGTFITLRKISRGVE